MSRNPFFTIACCLFGSIIVGCGVTLGAAGLMVIGFTVIGFPAAIGVVEFKQSTQQLVTSIAREQDATLTARWMSDPQPIRSATQAYLSGALDVDEYVERVNNCSSEIVVASAAACPSCSVNDGSYISGCMECSRRYTVNQAGRISVRGELR